MALKQKHLTSSIVLIANVSSATFPPSVTHTLAIKTQEGGEKVCSDNYCVNHANQVRDITQTFSLVGSMVENTSEGRAHTSVHLGDAKHTYS